MKLIGILHGIAAYREAQEEYSPPNGVDPRDQIELVKTAYQFQVFPTLMPGSPPPHPLNFISGKYSSGENIFNINQIMMVLEGDIVMAPDTDKADLVLENLISILDENLGYRLKTANKTKSYVSNVVVEFDKGLEEHLHVIARMEEEINASRPGKPSFKIKRIGFGGENSAPLTDPLLAVEATEFLIERRASRPFSDNRYFSSAPLRTADHIQALERIEAIFRGD